MFQVYAKDYVMGCFFSHYLNICVQIWNISFKKTNSLYKLSHLILTVYVVYVEYWDITETKKTIELLWFYWQRYHFAQKLQYLSISAVTVESKCQSKRLLSHGASFSIEVIKNYWLFVSQDHSYYTGSMFDPVVTLLIW